MSEDKPKKKDLTQLRRAFVEEVATGKTATQSVYDAGYKPKSREVARAMGTNLMAAPSIKNALAQKFSEKYPNIEERAADIVWSVLNDPNVRPMEKLKMLEFLARVKGWLAPTKQESRSVRATLELPKE